MRTVALHCSIDHRALDGFQIARINRLMRRIFDKPEEYFGERQIPRAPDAEVDVGV